MEVKHESQAHASGGGSTSGPSTVATGSLTSYAASESGARNSCERHTSAVRVTHSRARCVN